MNVYTKLAVSVIGGLLVASALVGTLVAVPHMLGQNTFGPGTMMSGQVFSRGADQSEFEDMQGFMDQYRTPDGRVDIDRMHEDLGRGSVTPPCLDNDAQSQDGLRRGPGGVRGFSSEMMGR